MKPKIYEQEKGNTLVLYASSEKQLNMINHCARYISYGITNNRICDINFIGIYKLMFDYRECQFNSRNNSWDSEMGKAPGMMDKIFAEIEKKYNVLEKDFYKQDLYETIKRIQNRYHENKERSWERHLEYEREERERESNEDFLRMCNNELRS